MEHRMGTRLCLELPIEVWRGGELSGRFYSNDVSHGGIFVCGCHKALKSGDFVDVKLKTHFFNAPRVYLMKAIAVHHSNRGVGLMWASSDESFHEDLERVRKRK